MDVDVASEGFLAQLRVERGLAANTIAAYARDLATLNGFLHTRSITLKTISPENILAFQGYLKSQGLASSSIQRNISTLRSFFKYCQREYSIDDPTLEIEKSKQLRKLPKALTVVEIISLIDGAYEESKPITLRDRALLELLYGTGARVSEIVALDVGDLRFFEQDGIEVETIKLKGKGSKERIVPLGSFAKGAIREYLVRVRPELAAHAKSRSSALFLNTRGARLSRQSAWQFVTNSAVKVGLQGKVSPHVFRHSYATHLLDGGADVRVVQELLGHVSVTTTQIYTLITIDKVRESYSAAHPRARG